MHRLAICTLSLLTIAPFSTARGEDAVIQIDAQRVLGKISPYLTGACIEDVNHEIYGGIYSQMVFGESFQEPSTLPSMPAASDRGQVSGMWRAVERGGARGRFDLTDNQPFVGVQSQRISFMSGQGEVGIENQGLNRQGMCFVAKRPYEGYLWARADKPTTLRAALENRAGSKSYATAQLEVQGGDEWQRLEFQLQPKAGDDAGRLAVLLTQPGTVTLGHAFLQPGTWGRFAAGSPSKPLPDRKDVVEALQAQRLTMLRYGGSMINHPAYRWKNMIGPRDRRTPTAGTWYPYSTNGWGIMDFLDLCEAAGFLGVPALNMGETPDDLADFVEYVNGPAGSAWGRRRAEDGHPRPYGLRHLELGNEERVDEAYAEKFTALAQAIWAKDGEMVLIVGDFVYDQVIEDPHRFTGAASRITSLAGHERILRLAREHDREVWFDVHIDTNGPLPSRSLHALSSYVESLAKVADGARHKVVVFEFNAGNHAFRRALANATAINAIERLGGRVAMAASANCLQVDGQNDNDWNQGLLFMNPCRVWPQPPYFVTQMVARHYQPVVVQARVEGGDLLDVSAKRSEDGRTLVLQVVNLGEQVVAARLQMEGFSPNKPVATAEELIAPLEAVNTADQPDGVRAKTRQWRHDMTGRETRYSFPARSFTVLRFD